MRAIPQLALKSAWKHERSAVTDTGNGGRILLG